MEIKKITPLNNIGHTAYLQGGLELFSPYLCTANKFNHLLKKIS